MFSITASIQSYRELFVQLTFTCTLQIRLGGRNKIPQQSAGYPIWSEISNLSDWSNEVSLYDSWCRYLWIESMVYFSCEFYAPNLSFKFQVLLEFVYLVTLYRQVMEDLWWWHWPISSGKSGELPPQVTLPISFHRVCILCIIYFVLKWASYG